MQDIKLSELKASALRQFLDEHGIIKKSDLLFLIETRNKVQTLEEQNRRLVGEKEVLERLIKEGQKILEQKDRLIATMHQAGSELEQRLALISR